MTEIRSPGGRNIALGPGETRLMGVLNVTPDSFSDGGRWVDVADAVAAGVAMAAAGASVIDVGGESTRPGHQPVPAAIQIERVVPVIRGLRPQVAVPISIDTTLAEVAVAALAAGADWVNDTSALQRDPELAAVIAAHACPVVLMHSFDPPRAAGSASVGAAVVAEIVRSLEGRLRAAATAGIAPEQILLDPGIGFGTLADDNVAICGHIAELRQLGRPLVVGPSRKSFLGHLTGRDTGDRLIATAACVAILANAGVDLVRVHDVAEMMDVVRVVDAIRNGVHS